MLIVRAPAAAAAWHTAARESPSLRGPSRSGRATPPAPARRRAAWWRRLGRSSFPYPRRDLVGLRLCRGRRLARDVAARQPRHHLAQLPPDLLDRLLLLLRARRVKVRRAVPVFGDPALGVRAVLDVLQDFAHLLAHARVDDPRADGVVAVLGGVAHRVAHVAEAALVDEVDDELHLVHALEVRDLGLVARVDEGLPARLHELADAAAEDDLLAEPVGLDLLLERRLDDAGARRAHALGVRARGLPGLARAALVHRGERRDALTLRES